MSRVLILTATLAAVALAIAGCSSKSGKNVSLDPFAGKGSPHYKGTGPLPWGGGRRHLGEPYQVAGRWFTPKEQPAYDKTGIASWYGEAFNRRQTSNGEWFDMNRLTAAHPTLPLPSYVKVTNLENGREVIVRVNDRGPFVGTRIIDLSKKTASVLDFKSKGKAEVRVQYIGPAPLGDDGGNHLLAMNDELERGTPLRRMIAAADRGLGTAGSDGVEVAEAEPIARQPEPVETVAYAPEQEIAVESVADDDVSYFVQIGSFADPDNAERARAQFESAWPVQFIELSGSSGPIYRVRLGPIAGREDAETALEGAVSAGFPDAHMIAAQAMQAALQ